ncbi:MAG: RNA polymerase sigma factor RpoE [Succinivibrio sp.]|uniref:RNA polymerase sigma factor RpoE n=1 Tax=Succinivibrio faecicola TaxID=2820300 RepID=A0ABS7DIZ5_9GAMM|nr:MULTISPECIES: RNA polymerase sigma factor RpoE [Succinivibrio]MBW7570511.1 RNA polymerase sigma factor RpoE [Succinivibrio faecicola]MCI6938650.1 RNA polymerase sigma factor RpoE [Succinatimonas hippei]MDD6206644.1 RNA polymerase sigma factor RpoE [Succinivibrio sp.]
MGSVNENFKASNDEAIVKRVQEGDVEAYNLLVIKYQHKIFQVIGKFVNNQADIADVAQEAFIKAYRAINSFRADSSFYTWLYRIAVNTAKTHLESNNKTRNHLDVDSPEFQSIDEQGVLASSDTPDRIIESQELQQVIIDAMADLPTELSEAITLREVEGMSYEDMAVVLKVPIGTVRSRIFRARQFIEQRMTKFAK